MEFVAHAIGDTHDWPIEPASPHRKWLRDTPDSFALRCLPLLMANQAGWIIGSPIRFAVLWDGEGSPHSSLSIQYHVPQDHDRKIVSSHFGSGIVTFSIPYLFRTPPGVNLLVRGAPNYFKEHCCPLEGLVETDWAVATFTMNWKILTPNKVVSFERGDPICFIQPIDVSVIERLNPRIESISDNEYLLSQHLEWSESRSAFNSTKDRGSSWQKHYFKGELPNGQKVEKHRTRCDIKPFKIG